MKCQYCGSEIESTVVGVCSVCGSPLQSFTQGTIYANNTDSSSSQAMNSGAFNAAYGQPVQVQNYSQQYPQPQMNNQQQNVQPQMMNNQQQYPQQMAQAQMNNPQQMYQGVNQPGLGNVFTQPNISKKDFINLPELGDWKKNFKETMILSYVIIAINMIIAAIYNPVGAVVILVFLGLILGIHLGLNKPCAIILLVLSIINLILNMISGVSAGYVLVAIGGWSVKLLFDLDKLWKEFQSTGVVPTYVLRRKNQK